MQSDTTDADDKKEFTFTIPSTNRKTAASSSSSKEMQCHTAREPKRRIVATTDKWHQYINNSGSLNLESVLQHKFVVSQIQKKLGGYRHQDVKKDRFTPTEFVNYADVCKLILESVGKCYYCEQTTRLMYENVLDPQQWTLDRIDNTMGHNRTNVIIACLSCNLRRRCAHTSKYVMTKQLQCITLLEPPDTSS
jgi:hypothetical protein